MHHRNTSATVPYFTPFEVQPHAAELPVHFTLMKDHTPHPLCALAADQLQQYLQTQDEWSHNFGLNPQQQGIVIGKMFGVMVVQTAGGSIGYLAAFSGKLAGSNQYQQFVPPIYDALAPGGFLSPGMHRLAQLSGHIRQLETEQPEDLQKQLNDARSLRKNLSIALQQQLFEHYTCINFDGEAKSMHAIFESAGYNNPPAGAGECATPKLLQYAFENELKPLAVAEFWWGQSPKSTYWKHGHFYPCCKEKCEPILAHMLRGLPHRIQ